MIYILKFLHLMTNLESIPSIIVVNTSFTFCDVVSLNASNIPALNILKKIFDGLKIIKIF